MQEISGHWVGTEQKAGFYGSDVEEISSRLSTSTSSSPPPSSSSWSSVFCTSEPKILRSWLHNIIDCE